MQTQTPGLLISFDGLDSTGKATQAKKVVERLRSQGYTVLEVSTPDYNTPSGQEIKLRFQNKVGNWEQTPWQEKLGYFARNRAEHRDEVMAAIAKGHMVVYDRYVPSSLAFITVEAMIEGKTDLSRQAIWRAIEKEEYISHQMPKEDVSIFLDVNPALAEKLLNKRKEVTKDGHEYTDYIHVQEKLYQEYDAMCTSDPKRFARITCLQDDVLQSPEKVGRLVWAELTKRFPQLEKNPV